MNYIILGRPKCPLCAAGQLRYLALWHPAAVHPSRAAPLFRPPVPVCACPTPAQPCKSAHGGLRATAPTPPTRRPRACGRSPVLPFRSPSPSRALQREGSERFCRQGLQARYPSRRRSYKSERHRITGPMHSITCAAASRVALDR